MRGLLSVIERKAARITPESHPLGRIIFKRLTNILMNIDNINSLELTIFESLTEQNAIQVEDGNLGVNVLAVPLAFYYAYTEFNNDTTNESIDDITKCLVLCCSDYTTAWNKRKKLLLQDCVEENLEKESILTQFALKLHPKSSETYAHRRWIFSIKSQLIITANLRSQCLFNQSNLSGHVETPVGAIGPLLALARTEFEMCRETGKLQQSNYNGWGHKCWVTNYLKSYILTITSNKVSTKVDCETACDKLLHFLKTDIMKRMITLETRVSDISVASSLLLSLSSWTEVALLRKNGRSISNISNNDVIRMWIEVLRHNSKLLRLYDAHEALWRHRTNMFLCFNRIIRINAELFENVQIELFSLERETTFYESFIPENRSFDGNTFARNHICCLSKFYK